MGFFDTLKSWGGKIYNGLKTGVGKVMNVGNKARDYVKKGWNVIKSIPVIGGIANDLVNTNIPIIGSSVADLANKADRYLDIGNDVNKILGNGTDVISQGQDLYNYYRGMKNKPPSDI